MSQGWKIAVSYMYIGVLCLGAASPVNAEPRIFDLSGLSPAATVANSALVSQTSAQRESLSQRAVAGTASTQGPTYKEKILHNFIGGSDGSSPWSGLIRDNAGNLYGTTSSGGQASWGLVFKIDPAGTETVLYSFTDAADGGWPTGGVIQDPAGNLYGTATYGGDRTGICSTRYSGCGVVFKLDPAGNETVLYSFTGSTDGALPSAGVIRDAAGNLYGTAAYGVDPNCPYFAYGCGVVFKLDPAGHETVLYSFTGGADGGMLIEQSPLLDESGNLYGTTLGGGNPNGICGGFWAGCGVVFEVGASGGETVLHAFSGPDGASPSGGVVRDSAGNLYGTTVFGGNLTCGKGQGCGVVFKLDPTGNETVLHAFNEGKGGGYPEAGVVFDAAGNLYGTTLGGGDATCNCGVVFKLDPAGHETVVYSFTGGADGSFPWTGSLVLDNAGNLYGATSRGGYPCSCGVVFELKPQMLVMPTSGTVTQPFLGTFSHEFSGAYYDQQDQPADTSSLFGTVKVHAGVDIQGGPIDCVVPVYAAAAGKVLTAKAQKDKNGKAIGAGWEVIIAHGQSVSPSGKYVFTAYFHMGQKNNPDGTPGASCLAPGLAEGQTVTAGQFIGYQGSSGNVKSQNGGPTTHLHWEIHVNPSANNYNVDQGAFRASPDFYTCLNLTNKDPAPTLSVTALKNGC